MKALLLLTLIVFTSCNSFEGISNFVKCLKKENIMEPVQNVIKSFKTKDISSIFTTLLSAFYALKDSIKNCLNAKPTLRKLQNCANPELYEKCREKCKGPMHLLCKKDCYNCWCL